MEKEEIRKRALAVKSKLDLLTLINDVKADVIGEKAHPISMRQISYHCNPNRMWNRYVLYKIPKKAGGYRRICAPNKTLRELQRWLNIIFEAVYTPSQYAMGFATGKNVAMNASVHTGKNYVFNIDLKDFFPSIHQARVWKRLQLPPFNFSIEIANVIAGLCCMKQLNGDNPATYILPQGAPTSPLLTNAICDTLDRRLSGLARRFGVEYTRYADDITFSSMHNVYADGSEFRNELSRIILDQNFEINDKKTRLQKRGERQEVTGLTVNHCVNVTRKYVREIRDLLYMWSKYGYSVASMRFVPRYKASKGHVKKGEPNLENVLSGKLLYLRMVKGVDDPVYARLNSQFESLTSRFHETAVQFDDTGEIYLESYTLDDFEAQHQVKIESGLSSTGVLGFWFVRNGKKIWVKTKLDNLEHKRSKLAISLCKKDKRTYYRLHYAMSVKTITENSRNNPKVVEDTLSRLFDSGFDLNILV